MLLVIFSFYTGSAYNVCDCFHYITKFQSKIYWSWWNLLFWSIVRLARWRSHEQTIEILRFQDGKWMIFWKYVFTKNLVDKLTVVCFCLQIKN